MKVSWPIISIFSRFTAQGIGFIQSLIIADLLSVGDYGLTGLVASIAAMVGVYQNLGISSASTREVAAADNKEDAFKVFIGSTIVRYTIAFPLVVGLILLAPYIGNNYYERPIIVVPIIYTAIVLFIQALQSVLSSVIQGMRQFAFLFSFQVGIALISLILYVFFVSKYEFIGFYYALLWLNVVWTAVLGLYCLYIFRGHFTLPSRKELVSIIKAVFAIGIFVYVIKIIVIFWQRSGTLLLATEVDNIALGVLTFALAISKNIGVISDAVTDVSLPSMTDIYEKSTDKFKSAFLAGNSKAFLLILFASVMLIFLKEELFIILDYFLAFVDKGPIYKKYYDSFAIMDPLIIGFWAYSNINLLKAGLSIPTKKMWGALFSFLLLAITTIGTYYILNIRIEALQAYLIAMAVGSIGAYLFYIVIGTKAVGFMPITAKDIGYFLVSSGFLVVYYFDFIPPVALSIAFAFITAIFFIKLKKINE